jgi:predicted lysophospholipase L1 biosynthesis ABC-type transport system permease subunit
LYGLVALIAAQRTKEIGIRKVLGATLLQLFTLMTKDFVILVGSGILVSLPVAGFLMHGWLATYAFHVNLYWWMFLVPIVFLMIITLITISKEVIKSAVQNPAEVLKEN